MEDKVFTIVVILMVINCMCLGIGIGILIGRSSYEEKVRYLEGVLSKYEAWYKSVTGYSVKRSNKWRR